jgi:hypothetical protein
MAASVCNHQLIGEIEMPKASSGRDAVRMRGYPNPLRVDDHHRSANNGAPSYPKPGATTGGHLNAKGKGEGAYRPYGQMADEYSRSGIMTKASTRFDRYTGPGSVSSVGPLKPRGPVSYKDREGVA